jgi:hypothetical protein
MMVRVLFPILLGIMFSLAVITGVSQMGSAIIREKEQRAMEIVITSLPPEALVAGKVLGLSLMALGQVAVWTGFAIGAGLLALASTGTVSLAIIPWSGLVWSLVLGLPTFLIYAVISAGLGVIAGDDQQSQQLAGILSLIGLLPFWTLPAILSAPGGTLSTVLTLFPLTSATVVLFRWGSHGAPVAAIGGPIHRPAVAWPPSLAGDTGLPGGHVDLWAALDLASGVGCLAQRLMPARERANIMRNTGWWRCASSSSEVCGREGFWFSAIGVPLMLFFIMSGTGRSAAIPPPRAVATQDADAGRSPATWDEAGLIQTPLRRWWAA